MSVATPAEIALCPVADLPIGLGRPFRVGGKLVAVFRGRAGRVFAMQGTCPHKNGPLADGMLAGDQVVCPLHAYRYDARDGTCDQAGACGLETYPVDVRDGMVHLTLCAE